MKIIKIAVLMSTYNGEKYVKEQIDSILLQKDVDVYLYIRDDGSTDETVKIINEYEKKYSNVVLINRNNRVNLGINKGVLEFLLFAKHKLLDSDYFAFADQDDKWLDDKLVSAVKLIDVYKNTQSINDQPVLYYSKKTWTDETLNKLYDDEIIDTKGNYFDMFMPVAAYGCTFVFNRKLLEKTLEGPPSYMLAYDVYMYRLARSMNSIIVADKTPHILYRRHENNVTSGGEPIIISISPIILIKRIISTKNAFHTVQRYVREIYSLHYDDLGEKQKELFELVLGYKKSFSKKIRLLFYQEAYNRGFKLAVLWFGKVLLNRV